MHESSPGTSGISQYFNTILGGKRGKYLPTQFSSTVPCGQEFGYNWTSLNLEAQTCIADESFDLVVTQDVFEHVMDHAAAFREIARTLKPGGYLVLTVPLTSKNQPSFTAAEFDKATQTVHLHAPPEVHGNPVNSDGSLLTKQWGYDIVDFIWKHAGMRAQIIYVDSPFLGIQFAEYREVVVARKAGRHPHFSSEVIDMCKDSYITCSESKKH